MDFFEVVHTQRSIRSFKPDPVPEEALWKMLDAAIRAPSGTNTQPWIWLVVRDQARREIIGNAIGEHMKSMGAAERMSETAQQMDDTSQRLVLQRSLAFFQKVATAPVLIIPCLVNVSSPVSDPRTLLAGSSIYAAVQNLMLAARNEGLGTALTTILCIAEPQVKSLLAIPDDIATTAMITLGWPVKSFPKKLHRKPLQDIAFLDRYGDAMPGAGAI